MTKPVLTIVVPCYNEEEVLPETISQLQELIGIMVRDSIVDEDSKILFVDDGSRDNTWSIIHKTSLQSNYVRGLKLSRNVGHQNALLAGLFSAKDVSDCVVSVDADLQDDISVIPTFVQKFMEGNEIVYGVRNRRDSDTLFKRKSAEIFYSVMKKIGVELIFNHADFRLMSKRAIEELARFDEANLFLRGIIPLIGFPSAVVPYERKKRFAGETKYPLKKMLAFAFDGISSFSVTPIRFVLFIGMVSFFGSLLFGAYFLFLKFSGNAQTGWTSLITSIWLIGGLQLIAIGLVGEYIGKVYKETKRRPKFIVEHDPFVIQKSIRARQFEKKEDELYTIASRKLPESN
ncbi:glycosyltransferase involved in cell wall bisynthesis [Bacillus oleivorans]|uniref:Glycosyltransferase involved in cell wall bisynthesis n=1 Tax=Bacillus oleivorans TaxID=1448271 RepID=A0A285CM15_9BACI|nr:glycosyltransferase family 2 protein [Bacillus oleivorans]SNX68076.1 glycosyltransferase involved in cell wall bisynthesis [Bacillus oleivorans]